MLHAHCDRLDKEVLIWMSSIVGIDNTDEGIVVTYVCACHQPAQMLTGARVPVATSHHLAA